MRQDAANSSGNQLTTEPREICGYTVLRWFKPGRTALCLSGRESDGAREVVLKRLDSDCLLSGDLHPDIRERLARIRELAHKRVATLIAVLQDPSGGAWACWQHIKGEPFLDWVCDESRDSAHAARMLRELAIAVEGLHVQGLVHGALHDGNLLVDESGELHVLDLSPLLFYEQQVDVRAIGELIRTALNRRGETQTPGGMALLAQLSSGGDLRAISSAIGRAIQTAELQTPPAEKTLQRQESRARRRARFSALACTLIAAVLALWLWKSLSRPEKQPPEAPPEAMLGNSSL